jgi:hypothetical protein
VLAKNHDRAVRTRSVLDTQECEHPALRRALRALRKLADFVIGENHCRVEPSMRRSRDILKDAAS